MRIEELEPCVEQARAHLFSFPNVRSVGAGNVWEEGRMTQELGIIVGVEAKLPEAMLAPENIIPRELAGTGIRIDVWRAGDPRPLYLLPPNDLPGSSEGSAIPEYDCSWYETMRSGVGLAHFQVTGGTLGDYRGGDWDLGVSNNHVVANQNNASPGDPIYQPSPICQAGNRIVAELVAFEPIKFLGENSQCPWSRSWVAFWNYFMQTANRQTRFKALTKLDPFAAETVNHVDIGFIRFKEGIAKDERIERTEKEWLGYRDEAELGEMLFKSGARTRYTEFPCIQKYVSVSIQYSLGRIAMFENQDIGDNPGGTKLNSGDSGDMPGGVSDTKRTDLAFAGSDTISILSPYRYVEEAYHRLVSLELPEAPYLRGSR